jgi:FixJ family two-component response regulator
VCPENFLIAVVDDDESFRIPLVESLNSLGYGAHGFPSAEEFIAGAGEGLYDCLVTDIDMPGISGLDLKRFLADRGSRVPVIMITALAEPDLEARVAAAGVVFLLRKPFEADALIDCLERTLKT